MDYKMIKEYKDNTGLRSSFNELAGLVFGIDFERWYQLGFWNDRYRCYSFEYGGKVVANVSANLMNMIIDGRRVNAIQIGTVMTHPDHRRKGLAEKLMNVVLSEYEKNSDMIFLFANMDAAGFYSRFGFDTATETQFSTVISIKTNQYPGTRKLEMDDPKDVEILRRLAFNRIPLSAAFGVEHAEGILEWHCLNVFPKELFYVEEPEAIVICRRNDKTVELYDIISGGGCDLREIIGAVVPEGLYEVNFHYTPKQEGIPVVRKPYRTDEYIFFVKSDTVCLNGEFFYPHTAHA